MERLTSLIVPSSMEYIGNILRVRSSSCSAFQRSDRVSTISIRPSLYSCVYLATMRSVVVSKLMRWLQPCGKYGGVKSEEY